MGLFLVNCEFNVQATSENQTISSPGYPTSYFNDLNCKWNITARTGFYIQLEFTDFATETFDIVYVSDDETSFTGMSSALKFSVLLFCVEDTDQSCQWAKDVEPDPNRTRFFKSEPKF